MQYQSHTRIWVICSLIVVCGPVSFAWHLLDNVKYHCWTLTATATNPATIPCEGVSIRWTEPPPGTIRAQKSFNVTYELLLSDNFYVWAYNSSYFSHANATSWSDAKSWCESKPCLTSGTATKDNCCVWHVNVHTCPLEQTDSALCGPWIPKTGKVFTHTDVLVGSVNTGNWTSYIPGMYQIGVNSMIAHFRVAQVQIVLEEKVNVQPRVVCGNGLCEPTDDVDSETCETCPADCGKCPLKSGEIAAIVVALLAVAGGFAGFYGYMQWQRQKLLWDETWIIPPENIKEDAGLKGAFGSMIASRVEVDGMGAVSTLNVNKQVFVRTAIYDGQPCAVRTVTKTDFTLTKNVRLEVRAVRECNHPNLCKFVGACIEVPHMCILSEYAPKGSLSDVLLNEEIPLNWAFRFSFDNDIASGMKYLHQKKIIHGRLKSNNCVVDDRWTVKICDYGLEILRANDEDEVLAEESMFKSLRDRVYQAPEYHSDFVHTPTIEGDVYAFAIIMIEIAMRTDPYGDEDQNSLKFPWKPRLPDFSQETIKDDPCPNPEAYNELIINCWNDYANMRPTFDKIKAAIRRINPSKLSAVDLMMNMMEKYSKHLEAIVAERTADLVAEKAKTDRLLYSMLPRTVADDLRQGRPIDAKFHDECTIYFSDIVGFTTISGASQPIEVVGLLNKLYITFDEIIDKYDVYKVETIGDAYMVVSGIPTYTPHHAREVADMAIDLVKACQTFVIPHLPGEPLKIRIGLHSGAACAGVVGIKMPRYCLFGDTVNTASRMESNSEAYRIHVSQYCYNYLKNYDKFSLEKRGTIAVKGKGDMVTYWLNGHSLAYMNEQEAIKKAATGLISVGPANN